MKRLTTVAACLVALASGAEAGEREFTGSLPPAEFASAGLNKLTSVELARLDALVRDYLQSAPRLNSARRDVARESVARPPSREDRSRESASTAPTNAGTRKVTVAPGTQVEYSDVESRIAGEFTGWEGRTVFTLENGQRWQTDGSSNYVGVRLQRPAVKIVPGLFGSFWMTIEGVKQRVRVVPLTSR